VVPGPNLFPLFRVSVLVETGFLPWFQNGDFKWERVSPEVIGGLHASIFRS
jgi:hypothetical protein